MHSISAYASHKEKESLKPWSYEPRNLESKDLLIEILYSGICGSDNDWHTSIYPVVPGHEIVGRVMEGSKSTKHPIGSIVGVGPQSFSCGSCSECQANLDPLCSKRVFTYSDIYVDGSITYGGYAKHIVVNEDYAIKIPNGMDLSRCAPLMCAGSTVYAPLSQIPKGSEVAILGIGGLGHLAIQFSKALGHRVSAISHSASKKDESISLGATKFYDLKQDLKNLSFAFDYIIITSSHGLESVDQYLQCLKMNGSLVLIGIPGERIAFTPSHLVSFNRNIRSSLILGKKGMAEMLQFAHIHSIYPIIETFPLSSVNDAIEKVRKGIIRYRAVLKVK